jgi:hypothetical protein
MDSGMIGKIEKALQYSQEPERIRFESFNVTFAGDHKEHRVSYREGTWGCDCHFFAARGVCSHIMTLERLLMAWVTPAEATPMPA